MQKIRSASSRRLQTFMRPSQHFGEITIVCVGMDVHEIEATVSLCGLAAEVNVLNTIEDLSISSIPTDSFVCVCEPKGSGWLRRMISESGKSVARNKSDCDYDQVYTKSGFPDLNPMFSVSLVVTVCSRPDVAIPCIRSIIDRTRYPFKRLIIMDDCSDDYTHHRLHSFKDRRIEIVSSEKNRGYIKQVNDGLDKAFVDSDYCVIINSDVLVTDGWLSSLVKAAYTQEADLVNPICNNAGGQSISFPSHPTSSMSIMDGGISYLKAAASISVRNPSYPLAITSIGQCLLISEEAWTEHGPFNSDVYGSGYGEESEFWADCVRAGKSAILADDCFVYHESHATFGSGSDSRERAGFKKFLERNRDTYFQQARKSGDFKNQISPIVKTINSSKTFGLPVSFLCNDIGPWGGVMAMMNISSGLNELGFDSDVNYLRKSNASKNQTPLIYPFGPRKMRSARSFKDWSSSGGCSEGLVFATHFHSVMYLESVMKSAPVTPAAFWQDREDYFRGPEGEVTVSSDFVRRYVSIPNRIANARWVSESAREDFKIDAFSTIPVGVDTDLFYPDLRPKNCGKIRILSMWRPITPRRGYKRLLQLYRRLKSEFGKFVSLEVYGQEQKSSLLDGLVDVHHGWLSQRQVADLVRGVDIVLEPSDFQGFGLPGLEAMASGKLLISTDNQGVHEYGQDGINCMITNDSDRVMNIVSVVVDNPHEYQFIKHRARKDALDFDWREIHCQWAEEILSWDVNWPIGFEKEARDIRIKCEKTRSFLEGKI